MAWLPWRRAPPAVVCYLRENGPIAYELTLFGAASRPVVDAMLGTDLAWYWKALARDWTRLTAWSLAALLADLAEDATSSLVLVGLSGPDAPAAPDERHIRRWMRAFAGDASGPAQIVVTRRAAGTDLVFVAQHPPEAIQNLLPAWGIDRERATRRSYARLGEASLETRL
ncbi:MAG TPA: hypothetical protein VFX12_07020 [Vicinamibacterales bacterium]|nr:hypothetical protein [Vicinamibacterales bacterium]